MSTTERRSNADAMSETSEATTTTTTFSGRSVNPDELRDLATVLGIPNIEDVHQERFRVDRRKLDTMVNGPVGEDEVNTAEHQETARAFFQKVMDSTNTYITWPQHLRRGAKSKKDPHVKVTGTIDRVREAKQQILEVLDTRQNHRVTMKLDVSYTDHSHIIGKGGLTIKKVMEETGCHIHFPDSNRSNHQEKSNQVSIAGDMAGVEIARARVRKLTPLVFSFELPVMGTNLQGVSGNLASYSTSPDIIKIQESYNVQVMFRTRPKLHATLVVVKGCEWEVDKVKQATTLLILHMCKDFVGQIQIQMSMEISPQHHQIVLGNHNSNKHTNLKTIMARTNTRIVFPDAGDPNIPSLKKSYVVITGPIDGVYQARQMLVGSLPLVLMFDLPEDAITSVNGDNVSRLMQELDVFINVRHKPKQNTMSVVVKGIERNASNIYEARRELLGLTEPSVKAEIPETYHIPNSTSFLSQSNSTTVGTMNPLVINENLSTVGMKVPPPTSYANLLATGPIAFSGQNNSMVFPNRTWGCPSVPPGFIAPMNSLHQSLELSYQLLQAQQQQQLQHSQHLQQQQQQINSNANRSIFNNSMLHSQNSSLSSSRHAALFDGKDSAYSSISSVTSSLSSPNTSPRNASPVDASSSSISELGASMLSNISGNSSMRTNLNNDKRPGELSPISFAEYDYEQKKLMAFRAMQSKPDPNDRRYPTTVWSGYGFSQTSPTVPSPTELHSGTPFGNTADLWKESNPDYDVSSSRDEKSNRARGMASNYIEHASSFKLKNLVYAHHSNLQSLLTSAGLEKYIRLFAANEVDLEIFSKLSEKDLVELGITAWGAKRKIMLLITEMNKRASPFSGSAAPGAERKNSFTTPTASTASSSTSSPPPAPRKGSLESHW